MKCFGTDTTLSHFWFICRFNLTWKETLNSKPKHFTLCKIILFIWMPKHSPLPIFMSQEQTKACKKPKTASHFHYELMHPRMANSSSKAEIHCCYPTTVPPQRAAGLWVAKWALGLWANLGRNAALPSSSRKGECDHCLYLLIPVLDKKRHIHTKKPLGFSRDGTPWSNKNSCEHTGRNRNSSYFVYNRAAASALDRLGC